MKNKIDYITKMLFFGALIDLVGKVLSQFDFPQEELHKLFYRVEKTYFPDEKKNNNTAPDGDLPQ